MLSMTPCWDRFSTHALNALELLQLVPGLLRGLVLALHGLAGRAGEVGARQGFRVGLDDPLFAVDVGVEDAAFVAGRNQGLGVHKTPVKLAFERGAVFGRAAGAAGKAVYLLHELLALLHEVLVVGLVLRVLGFGGGSLVAFYSVVHEQSQLIERLD